MILKHKTILVTGGTGSMGKKLVHRLLTGEMGTPKKLIVLSRDEAKQHEMRMSYLNRRVTTDEVIFNNFMNVLEFRIGDVRSYEDVCSAVKQADIVSLHAPNTPDTYDLINARTLAMMKPGSVVVNTARGSLIDEDALYQALKSGHLLGAGLDVFKVEPLPADSPLIGLDNVVLAPHMAGLDHESVEAMGRIAAQCIVDLHQGRWPEACVVNRELRSKWKW